MIPLNAIYRGLYGASRLARFDRRGMEDLDLTVEGFWQSFIAIPLSVPLLLVALSLPAVVVEEQVSWYRSLLDIVALAISWIAVLAAMLLLSKLVGRAHRFSAFAIAYNWTSVLLLAAVVLASGIASLFTGSQIAFAILLFVWIYSMVVTWLIIREGLEIDTMLAILLLLTITILQLVVDYGIGAAVGWIASTGASA